MDSGIQEVELSVLCDMLEESEVIESLDIGSAIVHQVSHPSRGRMVLVSTVCGRAAIKSF